MDNQIEERFEALEDQIYQLDNAAQLDDLTREHEATRAEVSILIDRVNELSQQVAELKSQLDTKGQRAKAKLAA